MKKLLIFYTLILVACNSGNSPALKDLKVIDVVDALNKIEPVNLSEIASSIEYIPLETNSNSLLRKVDKMNVIYENGIVYIADNFDCIKIFNEKGKHIRNLNKTGRGPGEYLRIVDVDIDLNNNNLCTLGSREINEYKSDGNLERRIIFPKESEYSISLHFKKSANNFFLTTSIVDTNFIYSTIVVDSNSNVIMKIKYPEEDKKYVKKLFKAKKRVKVIDPYLFKFKDKVRVINGNNKYILSINSDLTVDTAFIVEYGKYDMSMRPVIAGEKGTNRTGVPYLGRTFDVFESENYVFMQFYTGSLVKKHAIRTNSSTGKDYPYFYNCSVFNKKTGELKLLEQPEINHLGFIDDFENGPPFWPLYISSDNYTISLISAYDLIKYAANHKVSDELKALTNKLEENDNEILIKVKLLD